jgi:hypothetical protein
MKLPLRKRMEPNNSEVRWRIVASVNFEIDRNYFHR